MHNNTTRLPNRFDIVAGNSLHIEHFKFPKATIGYIMDVREDVKKSKNVNRNDGLPAYTPKAFTIKFFNEKIITISEETMNNIVSNKSLIIHSFKKSIESDNPKYNVGDLIFNKKNNKIYIIISYIDFNGYQDESTKLHSKYWYKIQSPGNKWEPISETIIENAIQLGFFQVHKKK